MKKKEKDHLHTRSIEELRKELTDVTKKLREVVMRGKGTKSRNLHEAKTLRIKRAILLTIMRGKELQT